MNELRVMLNKDIAYATKYLKVILFRVDSKCTRWNLIFLKLNLTYMKSRLKHHIIIKYIQGIISVASLGYASVSYVSTVRLAYENLNEY